MTFADCLRKYMSDIPCTASELSQVSGLAPSMISRYLRMEQSPGDKALRKLSAGLDFLSRDKGGPSLDTGAVFQAFQESLSGITIDYDHFVKNLQKLLAELNINNNELARSLNFDPSYISRILSGTRRPANLHQFLANVSDYISNKFFDTPYLPVIAGITECDPSEILSKEMLSFVIRRFLGSHTEPAEDIMIRFIADLDAFDLNRFNRNIDFEQTSIPFASLRLPQYHKYRGLDELRQGELTFLKSTILSNAVDDVFLYSDVPYEIMMSDQEYARQWTGGLNSLLRKGLKIQVIHNVHKPFDEILTDLTNWIPLYMTGQISPYYLREPSNHLFYHVLRSSGAACIDGGAIFGHERTGRFVFSRDMDDILYAHGRAKELLTQARPLMKIYRSDKKEQFQIDRDEVYLSASELEMIRTAPPIFTASERTLNRILSQNELTEEESRLIRYSHLQACRSFEEILMKGNLHLILPESAKKGGGKVSLPGFFLGKSLEYSDETYEFHLQDLKRFVETHPGVSVTFTKKRLYENIELLLSKGRCALISKLNSPEIHFIVYHSRIVQAFENLSETTL